MSSLLSLGRSYFAFAVPDVAASVTAFCLKDSIPLTCHQAGAAAEAPTAMVRDVVHFIDVMCAVEMRECHFADSPFRFLIEEILFHVFIIHDNVYIVNKNIYIFVKKYSLSLTIYMIPYIIHCEVMSV